MEYKKNKDWMLVRHEDISADSLIFFEEIFNYLQLDFSNHIKRKIIKSSSSANPVSTLDVNSININSRANIKRWKKDLKIDQINLIRLRTQDYWPYFYKQEDW